MCLLEISGSNPTQSGARPLKQEESLKRLFDPARYALSDLKSALNRALDAHDNDKALTDDDAPPPRSQDRVPFNGTYRFGWKAFDGSQEHVTMPPHEFLRSSVLALLGDDRQKKADQTPALFSSIRIFRMNFGQRARAMDRRLVLFTELIWRLSPPSRFRGREETNRRLGRRAQGVRRDAFARGARGSERAIDSRPSQSRR